MMSWSFCIKSLALALSVVIDNLRRAFLCRGTTTGASRGTAPFMVSPAMRTATGENVVQLQASRMAVHRHHLRAHRSPTMTSAPMKA
jgi:microcystin-dependent protein